MVKISFPNGDVKEFRAGISLSEIAESISQRLREDSLCAKVNETLTDLTTEITKDSSVEFLTSKNVQSLEVLRHSVAHVLAQAISRLYPSAKLAIGPAIDNGFYYDIDEDSIKDEDLENIENEMRKIISEDLKIQTKYLSLSQAKEFYKNNEYKLELLNSINLNKLKDDEKKEIEFEEDSIKFYVQGEFMDLCRGPHIARTGQIKAFKLDKTTKAYWRADSSNKQLTRIYGTAFFTSQDLKKHYELIEEAKKRDHRLIGKQMDLFSISDYAPGMPFFHNRGMVIWNELMDYWHKLHRADGYEIIKTPIMLNRTLWETSGHWFHYRENMYTSKVDDIDYAIKPMNCPGGILVYKTKSHSYREFPIKSGEIGLVHRHELSGALTGLFRVRCFHQDDAHIFMRHDQIKEQIIGVLNLLDKIYSSLGLTYHLELSTRPESGSIGSDENWENATNGLKSALIAFGKGYKLNPGDGAFYGPKIDVHLKDAIGRTHQCGTVQLDMNLPERFDMTYVDENDNRVRPVMIHRVIYGSFERFMGILIEHFAGKFPLWLSPVQIKIINVSDRHIEYCEQIKNKLENTGFRVESNYSNETLANRIRLAIDNDKPNYIIIIGDKDIENNKLSIRSRKIVDGKNEEFKLGIDEFIQMLKTEKDNKSL